MPQMNLDLEGLFDCCGAIGCAECKGDLDCPSLQAYRRIYGQGVHHEAAGDLRVWFPRAYDVEGVKEVESDATSDPMAEKWERLVRIEEEERRKRAMYSGKRRFIKRKKTDAE